MLRTGRISAIVPRNFFAASRFEPVWAARIGVILKDRDRIDAMTLTIEITDDLETVLKDQAQAQGVSAEQYARRVLEHELKSGGGPRRHISEVIRENMRDVPPDVL